MADISQLMRITKLEERGEESSQNAIQRFKVFPHSSVGKEPTCNAGDLGSILGLG